MVPLYNEAETIAPLLASLVEQTRHPAEAILVDAGSTDGTPGLVEQARAPFPLRLLRRGRLNPGEARNEGVRASTTDWVAFTDGGIVLDAEWLSELERRAHDEGSAVVFGTYDPTCDTTFRRCAALAYVPPRDRYGIRGPSTASLAMRRDVFDAVGGFPPFRAAEDLVFFERLGQQGLKIACAPAAVALWQTAPAAGATFRRFSVYSDANLAAGRARFWHLGLARQYAAVTAAVLLALLIGFPTAAAAAVLAWLLARALKAAWIKRGSLPFGTLNPAYVLGAAGLLVLIDAATAWGAARWAGRRALSSLARWR